MKSVQSDGNRLGMPLLTGRLSVAVRDAGRLFLNLFSHSQSVSCAVILSRETEEETEGKANGINQSAELKSDR